MLPSADVSATEEPEMPPKIMEATIFTSPRPPWMGRRICMQKLIMRLVMPPVFISSPASMNSGMAIISSLYTPFQMRWGIILRNMGWAALR